ncbi:MAG: hypothetical protein L0Y35_09805 [Flammeovirgaceae bacterium]|nr:hypothetical protein [Flammeovirgaceae bacterium]
MKKNTFLLVFAFVSSLVFAQEAPRKEFTISLSDKTIELDKGQTKSVTVTLNRSKSFQKSKATLGLASRLPEGITVTFEPAVGIFENSVALIKVNDKVNYGTYKIVLNGTLQNKTKGTILTLDIKENKNLVSVN